MLRSKLFELRENLQLRDLCSHCVKFFLFAKYRSVGNHRDIKCCFALGHFRNIKGRTSCVGVKVLRAKSIGPVYYLGQVHPKHGLRQVNKLLLLTNTT